MLHKFTHSFHIITLMCHFTPLTCSRRAFSNLAYTMSRFHRKGQFLVDWSQQLRCPMSLEMASGCEGFPQQSHGHVGGLSAQCSQLIITAICLKLLLTVDRLNPTSPNSTISDSVYEKITNVKMFGTVPEI